LVWVPIDTHTSVRVEGLISRELAWRKGRCVRRTTGPKRRHPRTRPRLPLRQRAVLDSPRSVRPYRPYRPYEIVSVLYDSVVATIDMSEARANLPAAVELARTEAVVLARYGAPAAVLISPERYDQLMTAFEDAEDVALFDAAMAEEGPDIPWEQVKADLGWT
jgi:antitoxin Phd